MDSLWAGVLAGYGIAIPVGAIAILILEVAIRRGLRPAFFAGAGAASADLAYSTLAVAGGAALTRRVEGIGTGFRLVSGLVLVGIALHGLWRAGSAGNVGGRVSERSDLATYGRFLALTIINPTTVVYFAAVVVGLGVADDMTMGDGVSFVAGAFLASLSWQTLLAALGAQAGVRLSERARTAVSVLGNLLILGLALVIVGGAL